ncbi:MAG TPA: peptide chain release factor N(5)-glutamine methyltransferase [Firmicutes bacterium]|nr:peptide chain release factor N(5)-glutamine methyltransferase [Bacillota bacterium]
MVKGVGPSGQVRVQDALRRGVEYLRSRGVPTPVLDAEVLLAWILGARREDLYTHPERVVSGDQLKRFDEALETRGSRVPVAYIRGKKEFMSLEFYVDRRVLIPRPETEILVETVVERLNQRAGRRTGQRAGRHATAGEAGPQAGPAPSLARLGETGYGKGDSGGHDCPLWVADIGTGSGAIAVCLARLVPGVHVFASDISAGALEVARINAEKHGVADRITFLEGDLFSPFSDFNTHGNGETRSFPRRCEHGPGPGGGFEEFEGGFDAIVSNPPYISSAEMRTLQDEITYEPEVALDGGEDGLRVCRGILSQAPWYLADGGFVALEVASNRAGDVREIALHYFEQVEIIHDYSGRERVALARGPLRNLLTRDLR